jgi:hypothetical protein
MNSVQEAEASMRSAIKDGTHSVLSPFPTPSEWAQILGTSASTASKAIMALLRAGELVRLDSARNYLVAGPELGRLAEQLLELAGVGTVGSRLPSRTELAAELGLSEEATGRLLEHLEEQGYLREFDRSNFTVAAVGRLTGRRFLTRSRGGHYMFCRPRDFRFGAFGALFYVVASTMDEVALFQAAGHGGIEAEVGMSVSADGEDQSAVRAGFYGAIEGAVALFERGRRRREVGLETVLAPIPVDGIYTDARLAVYLLGPVELSWLVYWERTELSEGRPNGGFALVTCDAAGAIHVGRCDLTGTPLEEPIEVFSVSHTRAFAHGSLLVIEDAVVQYAERV